MTIADDAARHRSWNTVMTAVPGTIDHAIDGANIKGRIPDALRGGRMLSNGPGWTAINGWTPIRLTAMAMSARWSSRRTAA